MTIYHPIEGFKGRIRLVKILIYVMVIAVALLMAVQLNSFFAFMVLGLIEPVANALTASLTRAMQKLTVTDAYIKTEQSDAVYFNQVERLECLPVKPPNFIQRLMWRQHPGSMMLRLHLKYDQKSDYDLSLFTFDDRIAILRTVERYSELEIGSN